MGRGQFGAYVHALNACVCVFVCELPCARTVARSAFAMRVRRSTIIIARRRFVAGNEVRRVIVVVAVVVAIVLFRNGVADNHNALPVPHKYTDTHTHTYGVRNDDAHMCAEQVTGGRMGWSGGFSNTSRCDAGSIANWYKLNKTEFTPGDSVRE